MRTRWVGAGIAAIGGVPAGQRAMVVDGDTIVWTGADPADAPSADQTVDLGQGWFLPGFVDAHVHATGTGLSSMGLELAGARSAADVLAAVADHAARQPGRPIYGTGWDDLRWQDGRPSATQLTQASDGAAVILHRVDGHSCLVDRTLLAALDLRDLEQFVPRDEHGAPTGWLLESAGSRAQSAFADLLGEADLARARDAVCEAALALGITSFHEMGIPSLSTPADAAAWAGGNWPLAVEVYWAEPRIDLPLGIRPGGDLFLDGSIGSCTAATHQPYRGADGAQHGGVLFHDDDMVAQFFTAATRAGLGAGVHAIGDRAIQQAVDALSRAAAVCGVDAIRAARHRIEHLELVTHAQLVVLADLGVMASVQPAFDTAWNGPGELYEQRFGRAWADRTNPFAQIHQAGVAMCFSSDSTVTPMDPWGGVLAAERHHGGHSLDRRTALRAATINGHRAVGTDGDVGALAVGMRADFAVWPEDPLTVCDAAGLVPLAVVAAGQTRLLA